MITIRRSEERGHANHGWLETRHTFSFSSYQDPRFMGVSALRVINQDIVAPGTGFPAHRHENMEILTWVLRGAVTHRDSMGNEVRVGPGECQLMSAGTGVTHSEYNREREELELLQIWIYPNTHNTEPSYQQKRFPDAETLQLLVSPDGANDSLRIRQKARVWRGRLDEGQEAAHTLVGKTAWVQQIRGSLALDDATTLHDGDGADIRELPELRFHAQSDSEFLLFDLP
ncbi:MAG: Pirin domain protein [Moraxellaceae bacterium]|jgi:redox-sensitive bicupin YhaK (pirin superfamily)|nr:Pirin domain protein [Moraxellaceae bacterium]